MRWAEFARAAPQFARLLEARALAIGVVLLGTTARSGYPRISPIEPLFAGGELYLGMNYGTKKALDLRRDPRLVIHSVVVRRYGDEGEVKVRGLAVPLTGEARERYIQAVERSIGWRPAEPFDAFAVDVVSAGFVRHDPHRGHEKVWRVWRAPAVEAVS